MSNGFAPVRRTIATRPAPGLNPRTKAMRALRVATGPGFGAAGVSERMLREATRY